MQELLRLQGCIFYFCVKCICRRFYFLLKALVWRRWVLAMVPVFVWWSIFSGPKVEFNSFFMLEIQG